MLYLLKYYLLKYYFVNKYIVRFFVEGFNCLEICLGKSKEAESKRVNKELANIRSKFKGVVCRFVLNIFVLVTAN